jgi:anti-sigma B factor antagonist
LETHVVPLAEYLETYDARLVQLVDPELQEDESSVGNTLATVWELSFAMVLRRSSAAADLLYLCAALAPEEIPKEMISRPAIEMEFLSRRVAPDGRIRIALSAATFEEAVAVLTHHSLVEMRGSNLFLHRLVQAVTRQRMGAELRTFWERFAAQLVDRVLDNPGALSAQQLLPQTIAASKNIEHHSDQRQATMKGTSILEQKIVTSKNIEHHSGQRQATMKVALIRDQSKPILRLEGDLDAISAHDARPTVAEVRTSQLQDLTVDISGVKFVDSSGVGFLVAIWKDIRARGGVCRIEGARDQPLSILRLLHLDRVLIAGT